MKCRICGTYELGNYTTCKACLNKGIKWCVACQKVLPLENFRQFAKGHRPICKCCEATKKEVPKQKKTTSSKAKQPKCNTCSYGFRDNTLGRYCCQYILIEGKRRDCDPAACDKYKKRGKNAKADGSGWAYY